MKYRKYDLNVIFVEDDDYIRTSFSTILTYLFHNVYTASNGQEALEIYKSNHDELSNPIDLIITDVRMPGMNGFELVKELRLINQDIYALIISAYNFGPHIDLINEISVLNSFLQKPLIGDDKFFKLCDLIESRIKENKFLKEQQSLKEQYKNAIETVAIVSKTDPNGMITYVNEAFCEVTGYSKEDLIGKTHRIMKHPDVNSEVYKNLWDTVYDKKIWQYKSLPSNGKNGQTYYFDTTVIPILDNKDDIIEFIAIRFDTTLLQNSMLSERKAKETQSIFLANMSHEIRTPLNGILGFLDLLKDFDSLSKQDAIQYIKLIDKSSHNLLEIINGILDLSKVQSGVVEKELVWFDLYSELENIQKLYSAKAYEKKINLYFKDESYILKEIKVYSDITKIRQVIANLLNNAVKFTAENGVIELKTTLIEKNSESLSIMFSVCDNGIGISEDKVDMIFKPFVQENQSTTRQYGGTGLGLSICKEFVQILGGDLQVSSSKDNGSVFSFTLEFEYSINESEIHIDEFQKNNQKKFTGNILVAEDVVINQKLIYAILKKYGIASTIVSNGQEAVEVFQDEANRFDLVFLDINMPILDGTEALKKIRLLQQEKNIFIPVVALTANAIAGDKEKFISQGFDHYLTKPIINKELQWILEMYLNYSIKTDVAQEKNEQDSLMQSQMLDIQQLADKINVPLEFYKELLNDLIELYVIEFPLLEKHLSSNNILKVQDIAHKLKGAFGNLALQEFYDLFKILEEKELLDDQYLNIVYEIKQLMDKYALCSNNTES